MFSYYRARYYDSNVGRFINEDPARFAKGAAAGSRIGTGVGAAAGALIGALLAEHACKDNQQKCKEQWISDIAWCDEMFANDPTLHLACTQLADLNAERCLDGLPRLNPDPRWYRKRY
jgi:hypothetical protein